VSLTATLVARPVTLDQLVALCDEIAALARAGVPLDRGLCDLARELPGRLGQTAQTIGQRLAAGEPLDQIVGSSEANFPPAFRAVVAAGLRAGNLPAAVEGVARAARRLSQLRLSIGAMLLYPMIVLFVAWQLFYFTIVKLAPVMVKMLAEVGVGDESWEATSAAIAHSAGWWGPAVPLVLAAWLAWLWYRTGQVARGVELHPLLAWTSLGAMRHMQRAGRMSATCDLLALLVAHGVPLDEAVSLATAAVGSREIERSGQQLAERIRKGQPIAPPPAGFPPLLAWTLTGGSSPEQLPAVLHRSAGLYREEATRRGQWLAIAVPLITTVVVGGLAVAAYAAITLTPWIVIMHRLAFDIP
jgi:general secretion pathway protein F